jgi:hypothetical protein
LAQLEELGTPTWLLVPNGYHRLDAAVFKERFPLMVVVSPSGAIPRVRAEVLVDLAYEEFPENTVIRTHAAPWSDPKEGVVEVCDTSGKVLVFNDLLFNPPRSGVRSWPYLWLGARRLQVPWLAQRMFAPDARQDWQTSQIGPENREPAPTGEHHARLQGQGVLRRRSRKRSRRHTAVTRPPADGVILAELDPRREPRCVFPSRGCVCRSEHPVGYEIKISEPMRFVRRDRTAHGPGHHQRSGCPQRRQAHRVGSKAYDGLLDVLDSRCIGTRNNR